MERPRRPGHPSLARPPAAACTITTSWRSAQRSLAKSRMDRAWVPIRRRIQTLPTEAVRLVAR